MGSNSSYANLNLKIGSLNIQGQSKNKNLKLRKIKNIFLRENFDILLVQETRSEGTINEKKNGVMYLILSKFF